MARLFDVATSVVALTELLTVPSGHVERLVLFGPVGLTGGARTWALTNDIEVVIASRRGNYRACRH